MRSPKALQGSVPRVQVEGYLPAPTSFSSSMSMLQAAIVGSGCGFS